MTEPLSSAESDKPSRVLVIRLGALGDLILCFQAFQDIRNAHPKAKIALLTMPAFAAFAAQMPWFDEIIVEERPSALELKKWVQLVRRIRAFNPERVYDLQGKTRQMILFALLCGPFGENLGPEWSGAAPLSSHPRPWPPLPTMHFTDFVAAQLTSAGIRSPSEKPDLTWLNAETTAFPIPGPYAILIPGCSPGHVYKRWPATHYAALARQLEGLGLASVVVGTKNEVDILTKICDASPRVINLGGKTSLLQLAGLARHANVVVGNDTGPTHLAATLGAPTLSLMSGRVRAVWSAPYGPLAKTLQREPLESLRIDEVLLALRPMLGK